MAMQFSTGLKNILLSRTAGQSLGNALDNGKLIVYDDSFVPTGPDEAIGAATSIIEYTTLGSGSFDLQFALVAAAGTLSKDAATWQGDATGNLTGNFFRYILTTDTGALSTTEVRIQGTVGGSPGADLFLANPAYASGNTYYIDAFAITIPNL